jgi:hypothetical protein
LLIAQKGGIAAGTDGSLYGPAKTRLPVRGVPADKGMPRFPIARPDRVAAIQLPPVFLHDIRGPQWRAR